MKPTATLTSAAPSFAFNAQPGERFFLASSGPIGAGAAAIIVEQRVVETDAWVTNTPATPAQGKHLSLDFTATAVFNRIRIASGDGTTLVNITM